MRGQRDESSASDESSAPPSKANDHESLLTSVDPEIVKAVVKPLLGMSALVFLLLIVSLLPGLHRVIPRTPITFASLVSALFTLGIVGVLVYVAPLIEKLILLRFGASNSLATNAAAITKYIDLLLAVFVAHWGLSDALRPFLSGADAVWIYDVTFLLLAVVPTAYITRHLYRSLDPAAELVTRKITRPSGPRVDSASTSVSNSADSNPADPPSLAPDGDTGRSSHDPASRSSGKVPLIPPVNGLVRYLRGGSRPHGEVLTKKERVLRILDDHDGRIEQTEIVTITGWSKSTVSRVLTEMKEEKVIVKTNIGQGNLIALPGHEPESLKSSDNDHE